MFCKNCGNELKQNEVFCGMCGSKVIIDNTSNISQNSNLNMHDQNISQTNYDYSQQSSSNNQNFNKKDNNWKNVASFVIGVVSFVLVFIFQILTMPLSIVGLVFGILAIKENKKYKIGLILNIISLVLAIPIYMLYSNILKSAPINPAIGTWNCKSFDGTGAKGDYIVTMQLNNDNEFIWNKYNDAKNNHVIGTYEFKDLHKTNYGKTTNYYQITLIGDEFVNNGKLQSDAYKSTYEMGILKDTDEAILMNVNTYNMYYCNRNDKSSSKIETSYSNNYDASKENNIKINKLTYTLPSNLTEGSMNTDTYKSYNYNSTNAYCKFRVNVYDLYNDLSIQKYFEDYVYDKEKDLSKIYTKAINGTEWNLLEVDGEYSYIRYGVYIDDKNAYGIEFSITEDYNKECLNLYDEIIESIKIN